MKKYLFVLLALMIFPISNADAKSWHHMGGYWRHHPVRVVKHHHDYVPAAFIAGVAGATIGSYIVSNQYKDVIIQPNQYYPPENGKKCFAVVSKSTGNVTQKCLDTSDNTDYEVLYVN